MNRGLDSVDLGAFFQRVRHDLKSPVATLEAARQVLAAHPLLERDDEVRAMVAIIGRAGRRLDRTIADVAQLLSPPPVVTVKPLPLAGLIDELRPRLAAEARALSIDLRLPSEGDLAGLVVLGEPETSARLVELVARSSLGWSRVAAAIEVDRTAPPRVVLRFIDDGPVHDAEQWRHLVDPYARASARGGRLCSGYELALAHRLALSLGVPLEHQALPDRGNLVQIALRQPS